MTESLELAIVKAKIDQQLAQAAVNYRGIIASAERITYTSENVGENLTAGLESLVKTINEAHRAGKARALAECQNWDRARNDLLDPITAILVDKKNQRSQIIQKNEQERAKMEDTRQKEENFGALLITLAKRIVNASQVSELVVIEKAIGTEKSRTAHYGDLLPFVVSKLDSLRPQIAKQKEHIKEIDDLSVLSPKDDGEALDFGQRKDLATEALYDSRIETQEIALASASRPTDGSQVAPIVPVARRSKWKWRFTDEAKARKHWPDYFFMIPDKKRFDELLDDYKERDQLPESGTMLLNNCLEFFLEKTY